MKTPATAIALYVVTMLTLGSVAQEAAEMNAAPELPPCIELTLTDNSRLSGVPALKTVPLTTAFAELELPLAQVRSLEIAADREQALVVLQNDDKLTGHTKLKEVRLAVLFGEVVVGIEHIKRMAVFPGGIKIAEGLLLWNRLDSADSVQNSVVGPAGTYNAGRFVDGRFGKAIELNMRESFGVTFPPEIVPGPAGCIELWAKLSDFPHELPWGSSPALVTVRGAGEERCLAFHFNANDGGGNGGLCVRVDGVGAAGTGSAGSWNYAQALKTETSQGWHHYAIVWSGKGIPSVQDGTSRVAVYVDGKLTSQSWCRKMGSTYSIPPNGRFGLLFHHNEAAPGTVTFDNIKIWNYAKTDFSDRNKE